MKTVGPPSWKSGSTTAICGLNQFCLGQSLNQFILANISTFSEFEEIQRWKKNKQFSISKVLRNYFYLTMSNRHKQLLNDSPLFQQTICSFQKQKLHEFFHTPLVNDQFSCLGITVHQPQYLFRREPFSCLFWYYLLSMSSWCHHVR